MVFKHYYDIGLNKMFAVVSRLLFFFTDNIMWAICGLYTIMCTAMDDYDNAIIMQI